MVIRFYVDGAWASTQDLDREIENESVASAVESLREALQSLVDAGEISYDTAYQATFKLFESGEDRSQRRQLNIRKA